ncbi:hypothetical protein B0H19DRAFT_1077744 [Mycena capillaripes]|nr:hypothetical protein B0H19DRAFT_1077744 [Mycena capillaripes]
MQLRQMPEFGQDSIINPRLGNTPAASCFLPPPSQPTARILAPSPMSSFLTQKVGCRMRNRDSAVHHEHNRVMLQKTIPLGNFQNTPLPRMPCRASHPDLKPPKQALNSPESTRPGFRLPEQLESPQDIAREPTSTANFNKMCSIHFQRHAL